MSQPLSQLQPTPSIRVRVELFADLRKHFAKEENGVRDVEIRPGTTVAGLLALLGIPDDDMVTVGINDVLATRQAVIEPGDRVTMFSPMEGG